MGRLSWYAAEPEAFFKGTRGFHGDLKGAYRMVIDLIYKNDGKLADDDGHIAGELGYHVRVWRRFKADLVGRGKLYIEGGFIRNEKADEVIKEAFSRLDQAAEAGKKSGEARRKRSAKGDTNADQNGFKPGLIGDQNGFKPGIDDADPAKNKDLAGTGVGTNTLQGQDTTVSPTKTETLEGRRGEDAPADKPVRVVKERQYAFERGRFRITVEQFAQWQEAFTNLDLRAALQSRYDWYMAKNGGVPDDWFMATSNWLSNKNREALAAKSGQSNVVRPAFKNRDERGYDAWMARLKNPNPLETRGL